MSILRLEDAMRALVQAREHLHRRTAVLYDGKMAKVIERFRFLEDISQYLGISLKVFTDEGFAIGWLRSKRP